MPAQRRRLPRAVCGVRRRTEQDLADADVDRFRDGRRDTVDRDRLGNRLRQLSTSTLTGPNTSTVDGSAVTVPTTNPSAGSPSTVGTTGTTLLPDGSNRHRDCRWIHLHDLDAERCPHIVAAKMKEPLARARRAQIEHGDELTSGDAVQRA